MGGVAMHMSHVYDNGELTFSEVKDIFQKASSGELVGTEKTDGINLFMSYSVKTGQTKAARNKGDIKDGGKTAEEIYQKYYDHDNQTLKDVFRDAMEAFQGAVQAVEPREQLKIFGDDADVYYNVEILDPRNPNVIHYDIKSLIIHQTGHVRHDEKTGEIEPIETKGQMNMLTKALQSPPGGEYDVRTDAVQNLRSLDNDVAAQEAADKLDAEITKYGISDQKTINDYLVARLIPYVRQNVILQKDKEALLIKRLMKVPGVKLPQILKSLPPAHAQIVRSLVKDNKLLSRTIAPLEEIIHEFSVKMLEGLESAFVLNNEQEISRLRKQVQDAVFAVKQANNPEAMSILKKHLNKLKSLENITTAAEGFVFKYGNETYKFTGNFAPVNQILGLFKYGRGKVAPMIHEDGEMSSTIANVAVVPGAFKPPHRGHLDMVRQYTTMAERVVIFMSPLPRKYPSGKEMSYKTALWLWQVYLKGAGLEDKVTISESPVNSPVGAAYNFIANDEDIDGWAQPGDTVILGVSIKDGDEKRFETAQEYAREGVKVLSGDEMSVEPVVGGESALSASRFREAIEEKNIEVVKEHLPDFLQDNAEEIANTLYSKAQTSIHEMIETEVREAVFDRLDEFSSAGGGNAQGAVNKPFGKWNPPNVWEDEDNKESYLVEETDSDDN